jgi:thioredoxin 1
MIHSVTDLNFTEEVIRSSIPVLVNFGAPWCGLCKAIEPTLIQFRDRWDSQIRLVNVNADDNFRLASSYRLTSLPTLLLFVDGRVAHRADNVRGRGDLLVSLDLIATTATMNRQVGDRVALGIDWQLATN